MSENEFDLMTPEELSLVVKKSEAERRPGQCR